MIIVWSVLEVTYRLGFDRPAQDGWVILSYGVDVLFFTDMLVSLRTALVKRDGEVVANQKQVAIAYLKVRIMFEFLCGGGRAGAKSRPCKKRSRASPGLVLPHASISIPLMRRLH